MVAIRVFVEGDATIIYADEDERGWRTMDCEVFRSKKEAEGVLALIRKLGKEPEDMSIDQLDNILFEYRVTNHLQANGTKK